MHTSLYYSVTAHPDDGQARSKHVGATNSENIYHLCILLAFISDYTTTHCAEHIKIVFGFLKGNQYITSCADVGDKLMYTVH
jgi:hypothetical protein